MATAEASGALTQEQLTATLAEWVDSSSKQLEASTNDVLENANAQFKAIFRRR